MNCHQAIARALKAEGVEYLFAFPHNPVIDACAQVGIKPVIGRTERTVINMADGLFATWPAASASGSWRFSTDPVPKMRSAESPRGLPIRRRS